MPKIAKLSFKHLGAVYLLITALTATPSFAQIKPGNLTQFTEQDGLPGIQVNNILQDKFGYIWVGTINSLARYDGHEFKRYYNNPNDSTSINGLIVWSIYEDKEGRIWTGTSPENLNVYSPVTRSFRNYPFKHLVDHLSNFEIGIVTMCEDLQDRIYFGVGSQYNTIKPGLLYYDKAEDQVKKFITPDSLEIHNVYRVIADKPGNIWILSASGFFKISVDRKLSRIRSIEREIVKNNDYVSDLKIDKEGFLWASTWQSRLYKFDPENENFMSYSSIKSGLENNSELHYTAIAVDENDNIWIGTNKGLQYFDRKKEKFEIFNDESNLLLEQTTVIALNIDSFGTLWIATYTKGLFKYEVRALLKSYSYSATDKNSITPGWANNIYEAKNGQIWITTSGQGLTSGISELNPQTGTIRSLPYRTTLPVADYISGIMEISPGEFYISTVIGLYQFSPGTNVMKKTSLIGVPDSVFIYQFHKDKRNNLWLCTIGGLFKKGKDDKSFRRYDLSRVTDGSASSNEITKSFESEKHGLWLLTNYGLFLYNYATDKIERHGFDKTTGDIFITQDINSLYEDSEGIVWVGTWQGGLSRYDVENRKIKTYTRNEGLPSMSIQGILADEGNDNLWLSTFEGLSRFNRKTGQFNNFSIADGVQSQLFADGAYLKTSRGQFIFGGSNGITIFNANDVNTNSTPPKVFLTDLKLFNKSVVPGEQSILKKAIYETREITLAHDQNNISIEFAAIHYSNPSKNKSSFKLENYDEEWREAGTQRTASYPMLPPGEYIFRVKAANNNGVWNEEGATLRIIINPPWWNTFWAYGLYLILFALAVFASDRYFRSRVIQKERERSRTRELEQAKEIQKAYTELKATQSQLIQSEKMASLGELTAGIAHEIQNPLNFVNNFSEVNSELIDELKSERQKAERERDLQLEDGLLNDISVNLEKILHHGKRADAIVKGMLQHSRTSSGHKEPTDINALADEYLRLAYHGLRAKDKSFNATLKTDFDESIGNINIIPPDIGRVILNLITNAFYAVHVETQNSASLQQTPQKQPNYNPTVIVSTKNMASHIEIHVKDNGPGIPSHILDKIFQPFFTTKPPGEGTGLGLSMSYDIVKAHGGELKVETKEGEGTEFTIILKDV
jgi:signal transduction histidine kinase/ligand-binding sensor domain-containing protein